MALGNTLAQNLSAVQPQPQAAVQNAGEQKEKSNIEQIREFKQLLDEGIITQEEFNPVSYTHLDVYKRQWMQIEV